MSDGAGVAVLAHRNGIRAAFVQGCITGQSSWIFPWIATVAKHVLHLISRSSCFCWAVLEEDLLALRPTFFPNAGWVALVADPVPPAYGTARRARLNRDRIRHRPRNSTIRIDGLHFERVCFPGHQTGEGESILAQRRAVGHDPPAIVKTAAFPQNNRQCLGESRHGR